MTNEKNDDARVEREQVEYRMGWNMAIDTVLGVLECGALRKGVTPAELADHVRVFKTDHNDALAPGELERARDSANEGESMACATETPATGRSLGSASNEREQALEEAARAIESMDLTTPALFASNRWNAAALIRSLAVKRIDGLAGNAPVGRQHLIAGDPNAKLYPNLHAVLAGCVSGAASEWPAVRVELRELCAALESAQERYELLLDKHRDDAPKRRFPEPCNMDVLVEHDRYEAMMLDVCRYRWLRSEEVATNPRYYPFWQEFNAKLLRERHMDALIDAAMVEPKERSL